MGENISDVDLERFLRRRDRISRDYLALGREGPAAVLDAHVLEEARAALEKDGSSSGWRRRRWPTITTLAATVLLSLGLILRVALESEQAVLAPPPAAAPERSANDALVPMQSAAEQPAAPPPRAPDPAPPELPRPQIEGEIRTGAERAKLTAPASVPVEAGARSREQFEEKRSDAPAASEPGLMKQEALRVEEAAVASAPAAAAAEPAPAETDTSRDYAPKRDSVSPARAPKASQRVLKSTNMADEAQRMREPEAWLDAIDELRANGRIEDADREMERFLAVYPHYLEEHPRPPTE